MMKRLLAFLAFGLAGCGGSLPFQPYDCTAPPPLGGLIKVKEPVAAKSYIVVLKPVGLRGAFSASQDLSAIASRAGATKVRTFRLFRGFSMLATEAAAKQIAREPGVAYVQENGMKRISPLRVPVATERWGRDRVTQRALPLDGLFNPDGTGEGIDVYGIDTGCELGSAEFTGRMGEGWSAFGGPPTDGHGHGTHTLSIAAGTRYGIAVKAKIHCVRVLDAQGSGTDADVIAGIDWAASHCKDNGLKCVLNLSLGGQAAPALDQAICRATERAVVAVAAGNDNLSACMYSPARVKQAMTLAASDITDYAAGFSNTGACVDFFAPGVDILAAVPGGTETMSGTSMASPCAAGVAALAYERHPALPPGAIVEDVVSRTTPNVIKGGTSDTNKNLVYAREQ